MYNNFIGKKYFKVFVKRNAAKKLMKLSKDLQQRIINVLETLKYNPLPKKIYDLRKLHGYKDAYRIRLGKVRIVYTILWGEGEIIIHYIGPREKAYK